MRRLLLLSTIPFSFAALLGAAPLVAANENSRDDATRTDTRTSDRDGGYYGGMNTERKGSGGADRTGDSGYETRTQDRQMGQGATGAQSGDRNTERDTTGERGTTGVTRDTGMGTGADR